MPLYGTLLDRGANGAYQAIIVASFCCASGCLWRGVASGVSELFAAAFALLLGRAPSPAGLWACASPIAASIADVIAASLSFNCRELMLCLNERVQLRVKEHSLQAQISGLPWPCRPVPW